MSKTYNFTVEICFNKCLKKFLKYKEKKIIVIAKKFNYELIN